MSLTILHGREIGLWAENSDGGDTERTVPDSSDIIGSAETNVTVTVNTNTATRQG